jgi:hypothetical protein
MMMMMMMMKSAINGKWDNYKKSLLYNDDYSVEIYGSFIIVNHDTPYYLYDTTA